MFRKLLSIVIIFIFSAAGISVAANKPAPDTGSGALLDNIADEPLPMPAALAKPAALATTTSENSSTGIQIIKAEFGTNKAVKDVTDKLKSMLKKGAINICVDASMFGENPKTAGGKQLFVTYMYEGKQETATFSQGAYFQVPDPLPGGYTENDYPAFHEDLACIDFDYYGFPHYTGGVFPEAQNAVYSDKFIPMNDLSVVIGSGLKKDDLRIALLIRKLEKWGAKTEISDKLTNKKTQILLNFPDYGKAAPDKPEGYTVNCSEKNGSKIIAVNGKDKLGLLWGIVSVLQLTKHDNGSEPAMRSSEITDYPDCLSRGVLSGRWDRAYEAMIFTKMNRIIVQDSAFEGACWSWRVPGPPILAHVRFADICYGLGLEYYTKIHPADAIPKFIASDEKDFQHLIWLVKKYYASKHMNLYWAYDDVRFGDGAPFPPQDKKRFGSAGKADAYAVQRLFTEVRKDYPDFKIGFCPPYYWSVGIYRSLYGESGVEYVKALQMLDPSIGIYWTGGSVKSYSFPKNLVDEIRGFMGRKPWIFKNVPGEHQGFRSLPSDERNWAAMSYNGFLQDIESLNLNTIGPKMISLDAILCDYMWNTAKYDPKRSTKNANDMLFGVDTYALLKEICDTVVAYDGFTNGKGGSVAEPNPTIALKQVDYEKSMAETAEKYQTALKNNKHINELSSVDEMFNWARNAVNASKDPKIMGLFYGYAMRPFAQKETAFDQQKDIFLMIDVFEGGFAKGYLPAMTGERFVKVVYGSDTKYSKLYTKFIADPFPPVNDYELYISGKVFPKNSADCNIKVMVNNTVVYEGPSGLGQADFFIKKIIIPKVVLKKYNELTISNMEKSSELDSPCIAISYVVIKKL